MSKTVAHFSDSTVFGGTERAILRLMGATDRTRWRPLLLHHASAPPSLVDGARECGVDAHEVPVVAGKFDLAALRVFATTIRQLRPTVLHAHLHWPLACKYGIVAAAAARVPAIVATAQLHVDLDHSGFVDLQHRLMTRLVDRYIAVSSDVAERLRQRFQVPASKITIIPNAVNAAELAAAADVHPNDWPAPPTRRSALVLARLETDKAVDVAIGAIALLADVDLVIAGTGSCRTALESQAARLGVAERVHFLGYRDDAAALLGRADVFVLPSRVEGLPLSILEAMAVGVPVIATDIGGTREAVHHERTGLLVPVGDARALADAIRRVLDEPEEAMLRTSAARERVVREFSLAAMATAVMDLYDAVSRTA